MLIPGALLVGLLFGVGTYLILQKSFVRLLFGFVLVSNGANLCVLMMSGAPTGKSEPVLAEVAIPGYEANPVDPLPQALVLTAIVIGFGMTAYLVFLLYRIFLDWKTTDAAQLEEEGERGT
jgi:multicomponent Na+:H+ antiporter subunit C